MKKKTPPKRRDPYAKALRRREFRQRVVKSSKYYSRKSKYGDIENGKD